MSIPPLSQFGDSLNMGTLGEAAEGKVASSGVLEDLRAFSECSIVDSGHHGILKEALELFHVGGCLLYLLGSSPLNFGELFPNRSPL